MSYQEKPTVILEGTGGWSDRVREIAYAGKHLDERATAPLHYANTPQDAVELAIRLAREDSRATESGHQEFR